MRSISRLTLLPTFNLPSVVASSVCGIRLIEKQEPATELVVKLTPLTVIDPLRAIYLDKDSGAPAYIVFNDHMIEPAAAAHFHLKMSNESFMRLSTRKLPGPRSSLPI